MVKINLLDLSEDKVIFEKGSDLTKSKPTKEEREFSLESVNELFQSSQTSKETESNKIVEDMQHRKSSEVSEIKKRPASSESFKTNIDEEESFDHSPKRRIFFVSFFIIVIVAAAALIYFYLIPKEGSETSGPISGTPGEVVKDDSQTTPKVSEEVQNVFSQNKAKNSFDINLAQKLLNTTKADIDFALLVISPDQVQFSIIADSRNSLASYQNTLKSQLPGTNIRLVSSEEMVMSGQNKILADFSFTLSGPGSSQPINNFQTIKSNNIKSMLNSLAQKHKLKLQYFKEGRRTQMKSLNQFKYYCNLSGNSKTLLNYIEEISNTYPAISFSKIAFNPLGGKDQFTARITMILNEPTTS
jgi:hypothetical protein